MLFLVLLVIFGKLNSELALDCLMVVLLYQERKLMPALMQGPEQQPDLLANNKQLQDIDEGYSLQCIRPSAPHRSRLPAALPVRFPGEVLQSSAPVVEMGMPLSSQHSTLYQLTRCPCHSPNT